MLNIYRFNLMVADYLEQYVELTRDWEAAEKIGERIASEIHSLINSDILPEGFFEE